MNAPIIGDEITIVLARRCYRGRVAEVVVPTKLSVSLVHDDYAGSGSYWFGVHEEDRAWFRGWGDDVEAAFLLQQSAVG